MAADCTCPCHEDHTTIDHLSRIVKSLRLDKADCSISWVEDTESTSDSKVLEDNLQLLKSLSSTYEAHIRSIREHNATPRLTPDNLPDETLTQIFEHIDYNVRSLAKLSHISSRIRRVILHGANLWAKLPLGTTLRKEAIAHIARYSGTLGLTAIIKLDSVYSNDAKLASMSALLDEMFRHSSRWTHAEFNIAHEWGTYIDEHFGRAELTSLRTLSFEDEYWDLQPFYRRWVMPQLDDVRSINDIPDALHPPETKTLTKCSFEVSGCKVTQMLKFLASTPNLTSLKVHLTEVTDSDSGVNHKTRKVNLQHLEYMEYTSSYPAYDAVEKLFKSLQCPNLKRLSYVSHVGEGGLDSYIDFAGHIRERYPSLVSFELNFDCGQTYKGTNVFFDEILCSLPTTVEKVRFDISIASLRTSRDTKGEAIGKNVSYPNLKSLDLEACSLIPEEGFYTNLSKCLGRLGVTLQHFQPSKHISEEGMENENALVTLQQAGVLVN